MNRLRLTALSVVIVLFGALSVADAPQAQYVMRGVNTDFFDMDVDYWSPPITIYRVKDTYQIHNLNFRVMRYETYCSHWQRVCVQYNSAGQCIRWENQCAQWAQRGWPVDKRIELRLRGLPALGENETETYEVSIRRVKPVGVGEDWVTTWVRDVKTQVPVVIRRFGDFSYSIEPKPQP